MNMIEKIARAICRERMQRINELYRENEPHRFKTKEVLARMIEDSWEFEIGTAKSALECLKEPNDDMVSTGGVWSEFPTLTFYAMINAALEGK